MANPTPRVASAIGPIAEAIITAGGDVDVVATYQRSFYVSARDGIVAVVTAALGNGPINIVIDDDAIPPGAGIHVGMTGRVEGHRLEIGGVLAIDTAMARRWHPVSPMFWSNEALARGLSHISAAVIPLLPTDGLAALVFAPASDATRTPTARAARNLIADLRHRLPGVLASDRWPTDCVASATLLIGMGPGLTPSGDDLLGGIMLALSALRRDALRDSLWQAIGEHLDALTVPVSAMHLSAAADGLGAEAMHTLLSALLTGDEDGIHRALPAVAALGATSGLDVLAGIVATFESHLATGDAPTRPGR